MANVRFLVAEVEAGCSQEGFESVQNAEPAAS